MLVFLALLLTYSQQLTISTSQPTCSCNQIQQNDICDQSQICQWIDNQCQRVNCSYATTQQQCDIVLPISYQCAWNNDECSDFTNCSDYIVTDKLECYDKFFCVEGQQLTNGSYTCADESNGSDEQDEQDEQYVNCSSINIQNDCNGNQQTNSIYCIWQNETCSTVEIQNCQMASQTIEDYCNIETCSYNSTSQECYDKSCNDNINQSDCNYFFSYDYTQITICQWKNQNCEDLNIDDLTYSQCLNSTLNTYVWDSNSQKCTQCGFSSIMNIVIFLLIVIF